MNGIIGLRLLSNPILRLWKIDTISFPISTNQQSMIKTKILFVSVDLLSKNY